MKILLLLALLLVLACAAMWIVGALLPREHAATRSTLLHQPPDRLYAAARDFSAHPQWREGVQAVELLPPGDAVARHRERSRHGAITYALRIAQPGEKLVTEIADDALPFGGTWTIEFARVGEGSTRVRITERGFVRTPLFRFLARFVFGHTRTMEQYLRDLGRKFGETAVISS